MRKIFATKILRDNFAELSKEIERHYPLEQNDLIIDIGSNDGNLLSTFKKKCKILGVTPENIAQFARKKGIPTIQDYFSKNLSGHQSLH